MNQNDKAPISRATRQQLQADAENVRGTALRKGITMNTHEEQRESAVAREFFEVGCWLRHLSRHLYALGPDGLAARIECAKRLFLAGIVNPRYDFFTVFEFGERQFDTIFEMGDAGAVIDALRKSIPDDATGRIEKAFAHFGWPLEGRKAA